jgi:hydroxymethylpyrimidine kinase/phosphomethylpyrimidine kinase
MKILASEWEMIDPNLKRTNPPVCLSVAGLDPSGGAGIIADARTFAAFGCFPSAAVTSITFQNTREVLGAVAQSAETVRGQIEPVFDDYEVAAAKTGMLPSEDVIRETASVFSGRGVSRLVVDPVVRSTSGFDLIDDRALSALVALLFPASTIVTPNIPEAERISGITVETVDDIERAAEVMRGFGAQNVLIKGGHLPGAFVLGTGSNDKVAMDFLFIGEKLTVLEAPYFETTATHGTGCTLSAAITGCLAHGLDLVESVTRAKRFVNRAIASAPVVGKGNSPINIDPDFAEFD